MSKSKMKYIAVGTALAAVAALGVTQKLQPRAAVAAGFAARVICACHFIGNRDSASCKNDLEPGMEPVTFSIDEKLKQVTAHYPVLASRSATFHESNGCVLDPKG